MRKNEGMKNEKAQPEELTRGKSLTGKAKKRKIGRPKVSLHVRFIRAILNPSIENAVDNKFVVIL